VTEPPIAIAGGDQLQSNHHEVQDPEGGERSADRRRVEQPGGSERDPGHEQTPEVRPWQHDHEQAHLHEVTDVEADTEKSDEVHADIVADEETGTGNEGRVR